MPWAPTHIFMKFVFWPRRMRALVALLLTGMVLFSGCLDSDGSPTDSVGGDEAGDQQGQGGGNADAAAGSPGQAQDMTDGSDAEGAGQTAGALETVGFSTVGELYTGVTANVGLPVGVMGPGGDRWFPLDEAGTLEGATLTMTWDAGNPTMESLLIGVGTTDSERNQAKEFEVARGTSPLTIDLGETGWTSNHFVIWAWTDGSTNPVAVSTMQEFEIEGELTFRRAP